MTNPKLPIKIRENISLSLPTQDVLDEIISANTFKNPAFESNELAGRSTWGVKEKIITYGYKDESLILPRGFARDLFKILREHEIEYELIDERVLVPCAFPIKLKDIELRAYQARAVDEAMRYDQGVIVSPTGSGKSLIGLSIARMRKQKTLIFVHRAELAKQWIDVIDKCMGIKAGFIGDGQWNVGNEITVVMVQTFAAKEKDAMALSNAFGLILLDEVHHAPASTFYETIGLFSAKYRYGLSATIRRRDGLDKLIFHSVGPVISTITKSEVENVGGAVPSLVFAVKTGFSPGLVDSWNQYIDLLSYDSKRNQLIIDLSQQSEGATLIIVDRITHAKQLSEMLERRKIDHVLAHGQIGKKDRADIMERIKSAKLTVGTTALIGEGIDVSIWGTLIMGSPISSEIKLLQAVGRIVRPSFGKERAFVYDLKDDCAFAGASFNKRFEIYKKNKIWVKFSLEDKAADQGDHAALTNWTSNKPTQAQIKSGL